eukprot:356701-Chlamydomonas_euryale.AAC.5
MCRRYPAAEGQRQRRCMRPMESCRKRGMARQRRCMRPMGKRQGRGTEHCGAACGRCGSGGGALGALRCGLFDARAHPAHVVAALCHPMCRAPQPARLGFCMPLVQAHAGTRAAQLQRACTCALQRAALGSARQHHLVHWGAAKHEGGASHSSGLERGGAGCATGRGSKHRERRGFVDEPGRVLARHRMLSCCSQRAH